MSGASAFAPETLMLTATNLALAAAVAACALAVAWGMCRELIERRRRSAPGLTCSVQTSRTLAA